MSHRILIVDDEDIVRSVLRSKLEDAGYEVAEAGGGKQAIERCTSEEFDLVITDILMPDTDGLETLIFLQKERPATKVIAITGSGNELHLQSALGLGAARTLMKPFRLEELVKAVRDLLPPQDDRG